MPIYEYRCSDCKRRVSVWWPSLSAVDETKARCERCGSAGLTRVVSAVRVMRHGARDADSNSGGGADDMDEGLLKEMEGLDENDPKSLGRFMRKMAAQTGESLGEEFEEVVGRLEKGEDPEAIEEKMGDVLGGPDGMGDEMGDPYGMGAPPPDPPADEAEAKPAKAGAKRTGRGLPKAARKPINKKGTPRSAARRAKQ